jgi:hypothetical protein
MGLVTVIYCLRFETSLFVASYNSQGYGGGIRPRPYTLNSRINSLFITFREPNREHRSQHLMLLRSYPLLRNLFQSRFGIHGTRIVDTERLCIRC